MTSTTASRNRTSFAWNSLKIILALGLVIFVFSRTNVADVLSTLRNASVFWLIVSALLYLSLTLSKALQYYVLMRNEWTYAQVLNVIIWQNAVSNFLLAGAGILTYITTARLEHDVKISRSVTIFLLTKAGDLTAIWFVLSLSSILVWPQISVLQIPVLVLIVAIGIAIACFFFTVLFRQRFISVLCRVLEKVGLSRIKLVEKGVSYLQGLADIKQTKVLRLFGLLLLYSFIYLAITIIWMYTNLAIFHLQPDVVAVIFVSVLTQLVSYFPVSVFGGLGISETSALYFWSFFNLPQDLLAPALIGLRIVFYLFNLIPLIYLPLYSAFLRPHEQA
jgi:uncharacterized membrane protein YbhN (UPF0104 family)